MTTESERSIEATGSDVEAAILMGLANLGVSRTEVDIKVIEEGSPGFLGIGVREAVVRLTVRDDRSAKEEFAGEQEDEDDFEEYADLESAGAEEGQKALEIVYDLLDKLHIDADVSLEQTEADDLTGERRKLINIHGDDMGILIGSRGETLNAFQHVARLITGHALQRRPGFIVDVEGYRSRREKALARLAERMAEKAVRRGRPLGLEPMPPNERRIIHITLRDNERVYTESSGEGSRRRVKIYPKSRRRQS